MKQLKRMTVVLTMQVSLEQIVFRVPVQGYELNIGKWQLCVHRQVLVRVIRSSPSMTWYHTED